MSLAERFWSKVDRCDVDECWPWVARARRPFGYGVIKIKGRQHQAHRVAWELTNGPIPAGLWVLHRCDNPPCCNPAHLFLGTHIDNVRDMESKGRGRRLHGVGSPNARLTSAAVEAIRVDGRTQREVAATFGISQSQVSRIRSRICWAPAGG